MSSCLLFEGYQKEKFFHLSSLRQIYSDYSGSVWLCDGISRCDKVEGLLKILTLFILIVLHCIYTFSELKF